MISRMKQSSLFEIIDHADKDRRFANQTGWEATKASPPIENGPGFIAEFDEERLKGQAKAVFNLMKDGSWLTLGEIKAAINGGSETGISATLRSFRKKPYGSHTLNKKRRGDPKRGLFEYQLIIKEIKRAS
jgi:hypothetical protein